MLHRSRLSVLAIASLLCLYSHELLAGEPADADTRSETTRIYEAFLSGWLGDDHSTVNLSRSADLPRTADLDEYVECAKADTGKNVHLAKTVSIDDLGSVLGNLSSVHLVDPKTWQLEDPGNLIAKGQSVDSAVTAGFSRALMKFSAITFNESHDTAFFTYSLRCGRLCGTGGALMFKKTSKGWMKSKEGCSSWMS